MWPFPRDHSQAPNPPPGQDGAPSGTPLETYEEKPGCGTRVTVAGAWAPIIINVSGESQSRCGKANLDAKPSLPAPEWGGPHQQEGESIPDALCSVNERVPAQVGPFLPSTHSVGFPPSIRLASGWLGVTGWGQGLGGEPEEADSPVGSAVTCWPCYVGAMGAGSKLTERNRGS